MTNAESMLVNQTTSLNPSAVAHQRAPAFALTASDPSAVPPRSDIACPSPFVAS
jgi:hypothetical protein